MSTGPSNVYDLAQSLLTAVVEQYDAEGVAPPGIQYVNGAGITPVGECGSLVVGWSRVYWGSPGFAEQQLPIRQQIGRVVDLSIWCFRCVTTFADGIEGATLDVAAENADAETIMTDAYLLPKAVKVGITSGVWQDYALGASIGPCVPIDPQGGISGCMIDIVTELS